MPPNVTASPEIIRIDFSAPVGSPVDPSSVCDALDRAIAEHDARRLLLDYRALGVHAEEIRAAVQAWAEANVLESIAAIVDSELARVRLNMTALSRRLPMRAFLGESDALAWLLDPEQRRPTREVKQRP